MLQFPFLASGVLHACIVALQGVCQLYRCAAFISSVLTDTFGNLGKYILRFKQMNLAIQTNIFCNLNKYILKFEQMLFSIRGEICFH